MGKRRLDADTRRFFDEFEAVRPSRFRAMGVIDPKKHLAVITWPSGKKRVIATRHAAFAKGGGFSYFVCPKCGQRCAKLWLVEEAPRCVRCCTALNIRHASRYGFGRAARRHAADASLDQLLAKLEATEPLRFKPAPAHWYGRSQIVYNSRALAKTATKQMIALRLRQLADQQAQYRAKDGDALTTYQPSPEARSILDLRPIWRAQTTEALQQALDAAQGIILRELTSDNAARRINAAKLLMRTKQAREYGLSA